MRAHVSFAAAGVITMVLLAPSARAQQLKAGADTGTGLSGADVPQVLKDIKADPYKAPAAPACKSVPAEIQQISDLIGPDLDADAGGKDKSLVSRGEGVARSLVPYRGVVRFVTGANKKDDELRDAIMAGVARRGFLRGVELDLKCNQPDPPPADPARSAAKPHKRSSKTRQG
jgi:hypothetical protein